MIESHYKNDLVTLDCGDCLSVLPDIDIVSLTVHTQKKVNFIDFH